MRHRLASPGRINKLHPHPFFVRLFQLEGTRAWVYLLRSNVAVFTGDPSDFKAGLMFLKFLLCLILAPCAAKRLAKSNAPSCGDG